MRVQWGWIQRGFVLGLIAGSLLSCSTTASEHPDASQPVTTPDAAIVDAEIDLCSLGACPMPADASGDSPVVDPNQCPSLATYCPQRASYADPAGTSAPSCAPVDTWPDAVAYFCVHGPAGRYLNCNGYNALVFGSVEFSTVFYFDSTSLALVAIASGTPYAIALDPSVPLRCVAGSSVPDVDPATCESYSSSPCQ